MSFSGIALLCSLPIPILAALYWHWRVYAVYKLVRDRNRNISYYWFSFQFQNQSFAKQLPGYVDFFHSQPDGLLACVATVRRQTRWVTVVMVLWMVLAIILFCISGASHSVGGIR